MMKWTLFLLMLLCTNLVFAQVEIKNVVNDYAGILTNDDAQITEIANSFREDVQFAVVTINSLEGKDIVQYSYDLANGHLGDTQKNNGLLLLISVDDRKYWFQVGRNIEPTFNDAKIGRIGRTYLVPNFRNNDYGKGVLKSVIAIKNILNGTEQEELNESALTNIQIAIIIFAIILIIFAGIASNYANRTKYFKAAKNSRKVFGPVWGSGSSGNSGNSGSSGGGSFGGGGAGGSW